jgi:molybdopterin molybdotransferase
MNKLLTALRAARNGRGSPAETVQTAAARGRVLAKDVTSPIQVPEFRRSTVDGYAVKYASTPGVMRVIGEVRMGESGGVVVHAGEAALVHTGGSVPEGADAVIMLEQTKPLDIATSKIQSTTKLAPGDNVIQAGEDVRAGDVVIKAGTRLREQEIAGLLTLGITTIDVARRPRVALIPSGDELVPPELPTRPGQVRNTNAPMLAALVERHGGEAIVFDVLPDIKAAFEQAAKQAMAQADMVLFMASTSVGDRDFVPEIVNGMGSPGILAHGILFRPGKPALFAVCDGIPVFGLPGNPISALVTGTLFAMPVLAELLGETVAAQQPSVKMALTREMKSPKDLEHWFPVRFVEGGAEPIPTKSNLIFGMVRADGMVCVPIGVERVAAGEIVDVRIW